jgi:hypothetical protein
MKELLAKLWSSISPSNIKDVSIYNAIKGLDDKPLPYKTYYAIINQNGTNAPVSTIIENTLETNLTWTRNTSGSYYLTSNNLFLVNKTIYNNSLTLRCGTEGNINNYSIIRNNDSIIEINTESDNFLIDAIIEIKVWN